MKRLLICIAALMLATAAWRSVVMVDPTETVIVTQFGRPMRTLAAPGLYFKPPYQSATSINRQLQLFDPRPSELLTSEKKRLNVDVFVCWRVAEPLRFLEAVGDTAGATALLRSKVRSTLAAEVGRRSLDELVSTEPASHRLEELMRAVADRCRSQAAADFGIEVVDVRLKRIGMPSQVRESVFRRMRAERARMARKYRAEGEEEALKIRAEADKQQAIVLAAAASQAESIRGVAEAEATAKYAAAHGQDPEFYRLLRSLEAYRIFLDEKTTVLLSSDSELLKYLTQPQAEQPKTP